MAFSGGICPGRVAECCDLGDCLYETCYCYQGTNGRDCCDASMFTISTSTSAQDGQDQTPCELLDSFIGDGTCDDEVNNSQCNYDGGDCCGDSVDTDYCTDCLCLDPNF